MNRRKVNVNVKEKRSCETWRSYDLGMLWKIQIWSKRIRVTCLLHVSQCRRITKLLPPNSWNEGLQIGWHNVVDIDQLVDVYKLWGLERYAAFIIVHFRFNLEVAKPLYWSRDPHQNDSSYGLHHPTIWRLPLIQIHASERSRRPLMSIHDMITWQNPLI
jgi:hypothetical protein